MQYNGARIVMECLKEQGVDTIFGYPGGANLPLYDELEHVDIRHVLTFHEQGAAHAADGYARATGRVGVCMATSGPGATNLVTGLATANADSVPVVAITGQVPTFMIGTDAFQEVDIYGITMPITKHNFLVEDVKDLAKIIRRAFKIAAEGRPGSVLVDIPRDVQTAVTEFTPISKMKENKEVLTDDFEQSLNKALEAISKAKRPVIQVGGGVNRAGAGKEALALAEKLNCPVVCTLMGISGMPSDHPLSLGLMGMHGLRPANQAICEADLIIAIGSRFSDRVTGKASIFGCGATMIQIDIDPAEVNKNVEAKIALIGNIQQILPILTEQAACGDYSEWRNQVNQWKLDNQTNSQTSELVPSQLFDTVNQALADQDFVVTTDVGQHQIWAAQYLKFKHNRTWVSSGGLGTMGFGYPAAVGAQLACPNKRVVHITGDGSFKMTGNEMYTAVWNKLPIITILLNNQALGMVRQLQHFFCEKRYVTTLLPHEMDFVMYAKSFGAEAIRVETNDQLVSALQKAMKATGPVVIDCKIAREELVVPMVAPNAPLNEFLA